MSRSSPGLYKPIFKSELLDILDLIRTDVEAVSTSDTASTTNVCKLLLLSIMDLITGIFVLVEQRNLLAVRVLMRSLVEYVIDITYLSLEDDRLLNERFVNYGKLIRYWSSAWLAKGKYADRLSTLEKEYRDYVQSNALEDVRESVYKDKRYGLTGLSNAEKLKRLGGFMPRAEFDLVDADKIAILDAVSFRIPVAPDDPSYWKILDDKIKRKYAKHYSGYSTDHRVERILSHKSPISPHFEQVIIAFKVSSNYTHPTPYAVSEYQLESEDQLCPVPKEDFNWFANERDLYHYSDLTFLACSDVLIRSGIVDIHKHFLELVDQTTYIKQFIRATYHQAKAHATRARH